MTEKIRVLIVDDHDMVRQGIRILLENFDDFEVVGEAPHGQAGVNLCNAHEPHVVLMDMKMPIMNGIEATKIIREQHPNIQVVALTSFDDENNVMDALQAGAISYTMKNVSIDELASIVRKAANGQSFLAPEATRALISATTRPPSVGHDLSDRENEVLGLMAKGLSNREIGKLLYISSSTVKNHVSSILSKFGASTRTQAVAMAVEHKLVDIEAAQGKE